MLQPAGPTEFSVQVSVGCIPLDAEAVTVGRPDANTHCYVLDWAAWESAGGAGDASAAAAAAALLPVGAPGELLVSGPRLARGYLGRADLTAAAFVPNPCYPLLEALLPEALRPHFRRAYRTGGPRAWALRLRSAPGSGGAYCCTGCCFLGLFMFCCALIAEGAGRPSVDRLCVDQMCVFSASLWPWCAGDLVRWRADGTLEYLGRVDHQVGVRARASIISWHPVGQYAQPVLHGGPCDTAPTQLFFYLNCCCLPATLGCPGQDRWGAHGSGGD